MSNQRELLKASTKASKPRNRKTNEKRSDSVHEFIHPKNAVMPALREGQLLVEVDHRSYRAI